MANVPLDFTIRAQELYGPNSAPWIQGLPQLLDRCTERFRIELANAFSNLSWNLVLKAVQRDGSPAVLKVCYEHIPLCVEVNTLKAFASRGGVRVIDWDEALGAAVLENIVPGEPLSAIEDDNVATEIFCNVFRRLHPSTTSAHHVPMLSTDDLSRFPTIEEHFAGIHRYRQRFHHVSDSGPIPVQWIRLAVNYLDELLATTTESELLHGDLHHGNILRQLDRQWLVIDPKGIVGDVHFEPIQYLLNYEERGGDRDSVLARRMEYISKHLHLNPARIAMWGIARGVLEACWSLEGHADTSRGIEIAERFAKWLEEAS